MADPQALQSFLVGLGFKVDEPGLRRFSEGVVGASTIVKDFAVAVAGMAVAVEESIRRTAKQFENLYYLSQQTGVAVSALRQWRFAFQQIGLSADDAANSLISIAASLRDNPGLRGLAQSIAPGFKNAQDILQGFAGRYRELMNRFGEDTPELDRAAIPIRRMAELFGISAEQLRQLAKNWDVLQRSREEQRKVAEAFGLNQDKAAKQATEAGRAWNEVWSTITTAFDLFTVETFPIVRDLLTDFAHWMRDEGAPVIRQWARDFGKFVNDPETYKTISKTAKEIGTAIASAARGLHDWVTEGDGIGKTKVALEDVAAVLRGIVVSGKWIIENWGNAVKLLRELTTPPNTNEPEIPEEQLRRRGLPVPPRTPAQTPLLDATIDPLNALRNLGGIILEIGTWIKGSVKGTPWVKIENTNEPIVVRFAADVYEQLVSSLAHALNLDGGLLSGVGAGGGTGSGGGEGGGHVGVAGGGRFPGRVRTPMPGGVNVPGAKGSIVQTVNDIAKSMGASSAVVTGLLAAAIGEGGLTETWRRGDHGTSFGPWQLHWGGELNNFLKQGGQPGNLPDQVRYVLRTMSQRVKGFLGLDDPNKVTQLMHDVFRDYGAHKSNVPAAAEIMRRHLRATSGGGGDAGYSPEALAFWEYNRAHPQNMLSWSQWQARLGADRHVRNTSIDSEHTTNIYIQGSGEPRGTAAAVSEVQGRESARHVRNLGTALV